MNLITIHESDNVRVDLTSGHKYASRNIFENESVIKYGYSIGNAVCSIREDELVHSHNLKTALGDLLEYKYSPFDDQQKSLTPPEIYAYVRDNGDIGIRNDIWIINTVGCVNKTAEILSRETGALSFSHPYGCSQLGDDHKLTQLILKGLILHPNAGGVLVLGLGCENNNIEEMKKVVGEYGNDRIRFLNVQDCNDEILEGVNIINQLKHQAFADKKTLVPVSKLKIGLKCGGSDGLSGITANPLVGQITDRLVSYGGKAVLTEVPEMFGAESILMNRCESEKVFNATVSLINNYKQYFRNHNQPVSENPSPGNKDGGITTLEEKSLGCVQKGGTAVVTDVLNYGEFAKKSGLSLLNGPGNDIVAVTNLTATGCHMILFTTGRGTPLGAPVPTVKISTNTDLFQRKKHWIDFDAGEMLVDSQKCRDELWEYICAVAQGQMTNNEKNGYREIAIFKDGVTL